MVNGEMLLASEISEKYGINETTIWSRFSNGVEGDDLIKPVKRAKQHLINGELIKLEDAAKKYGIAWSTIRARYNSGVEGNDLVDKKHYQ